MAVIGNQTTVTIAGQPVSVTGSVTSTQAAGSPNKYYANVNASGSTGMSTSGTLTYTVPAGTYFVGQAGGGTTASDAVTVNGIKYGSNAGMPLNLTFGPGITISVSVTANYTWSPIYISGILFYT